MIREFSLKQEVCFQVLPKFSELGALLNQEIQQQKNTVILASGDPLLFGIGRWISRRYSPDQLGFHPGVSSLQGACHKLGLSFQDCTVLSLHGRPVESIRRHLRSNSTLLILTDKNSNPQRLAKECVSAGFQDSKIHVVSDLGYESERSSSYAANELMHSRERFSDLHVTVISLKGQGKYFPTFPGIPDDAFQTGKEPGKGLITKREVRLNILSLLQPAPGDVGWDVGAGCGGLAVEWCFWSPDTDLHAVESNDERIGYLKKNTENFGVSQNLIPVHGEAPQILNSLPVANKVFIGGSGGDLRDILETCWAQLPVLNTHRSILVASAVTEETRAVLMSFMNELENSPEKHEAETLQISVSRSEKLAGQTVYRASLPVTLFRFEKLSSDTETSWL